MNPIRSQLKVENRDAYLLNLLNLNLDFRCSLAQVTSPRLDSDQSPRAGRDRQWLSLHHIRSPPGPDLRKHAADQQAYLCSLHTGIRILRPSLTNLSDSALVGREMISFPYADADAAHAGITVLLVRGKPSPPPT